ncbi:MAG TPA: hypothetical protein VEW28_02290 [Candidatus Kapabacteria bacterium]|nr:hypothetical protein [Candidatus Kapabacteria bacterium]
MKTHHHHLAVYLLALFSASTLFGQTPRSFSYQGLVLDATQKPVTGSHKITVTLYDAPLGGTALHTENFSAQVEDGIFGVIVGSVTPLEPTLAFDKQYWLGVSIDGVAELSPRTAIIPVPYAIHSSSADLASGLTADAKGVVTSVNEISGPLRLSGDSSVTVTQNGQNISLHSNFTGVRSLNGQTGAITLLAGAGTTLTPGNSTITITAAGGSGGTGIQGISNSDGTISIINPFGPTATIGLVGITTATNGQILTANGSGGASWQPNNQLLSVIANAPITGNGTTASHLAIAQANSSTNGYLFSTDWTTFNNKLSSVIADLPLIGSGTAASHLKITNGAANGDVLTWVNSAWASAASGNSTGWTLTGNLGTTAGSNFIGTRDSTAFEIHVYNYNTTTNEGTGRVLRIEPKRGSYSSPNWIAGYHGNGVASGVVGATIAGGGSSYLPDTVTGSFGSIGGGYSNKASDEGTVGGGYVNTAGDVATVGGGFGNIALDVGTVGGGDENEALGNVSTVGGGSENMAIGIASTVGGGQDDTASSDFSTVVGGIHNKASGFASVVGGGGNTTEWATIADAGGGSTDDSWGFNSGNTAAGDYSVVSGGGVDSMSGAANKAVGEYSVIAGGKGNLVFGANSTIAGGVRLELDGDGSFGFNNSNGTDSAIISTAGAAYFGNVNLWLGNTNNTAGQLRFYEAQSSSGAFPATSTYYTAFKAGTQSADITYTLPGSAPAANGNLLFATSGSSSTMSWSSGLVWDNSNTHLGINTSSPRAEIDVNTTGAIIVPVGTTNQRPANPVQGMIRYNTTTGKFEGYDGAAWQNL